MARIPAAEAKTWAKEKFTGYFTSPMIPFDDKLEISTAGIEANVDTLLGIGVNGMGFGFSEPWHLSHEERKLIISLWADIVGDRAVSYVHATDHSVRDTIELLRHAENSGVDAAMVWAPYEFAKSQEMACEWFEHVAGETDIPFILYNTYHSGIKLTPESIERLCALPAVCAVKNGVNEFVHTAQVVDRVGDLVVVSEPLEEHQPAALRYFDQQVMLGTTSVYLMQSPACQPIREYSELFRAGRTAEGWAAYNQLEPLRRIWQEMYEVLWDKNAATHPIALIKVWMDIIGMYGGPVRPPASVAPPGAREWLEGKLSESGWLDRLHVSTGAR